MTAADTELIGPARTATAERIVYRVVQDRHADDDGYPTTNALWELRSFGLNPDEEALVRAAEAMDRRDYVAGCHANVEELIGPVYGGYVEDAARRFIENEDDVLRAAVEILAGAAGGA